MSTLIQRKRIRLKVDWSKGAAGNDQIKDVYTNAAPDLWRGNDVQFELGIFHNNVLCSVANLASVTLEVKDDTDRDGTPLMTKTLDAADLDDTLAADTWNDGTKQHALITFTAQESNIALTSNEKTCWLVIACVTTDDPGHVITLGYTKLKVVEDGTGSAEAAPVNDPAYYTQPEADARFQQKHADGASVQFKDGQHPYLYCADDDLWYPLVVTHVNGQPTLGIGDGESL